METIDLDGTTLEGGGQLVRVALALSALSQTPISISKIRGNRASNSNKGKPGGLKHAHLAAVKWLCQTTKAETQGMEVGSTDLVFRPSQRIGKAEITEGDDIWKGVYEDGELVRYETHIPMSTPGSVALILQAILPYVLFLPSSVPLRLVISGGTNVSRSPSIEYISQVLLPVLSTKLGLPEIRSEVLRRGWSGGRSDIGKVTFEFLPMARGISLRSFEITEQRGEVTKIHASVIAPEKDDLQQMNEAILKQLKTSLPGVEVDFVIGEVSGNPQRCYLLLVAETSSGYRLASDCLAERILPKPGKKADKAKTEYNTQMISRVIKDLQKELSNGSCVDQHLEDQLVVFQALADGKTAVDSGSRPASLHTQTAQWVASKMINVDFDEKGGCLGAGLKSEES